MTALELHDLNKAFGGLRVTVTVNLTVEPGERRLIIGPNGAGKTTLFNLITGELRADSGRICCSATISPASRHDGALISDWRAPIRSSRCSQARRWRAT